MRNCLKKFPTCFLILVILVNSLVSKSQITHRDLLPTFGEQSVTQALVTPNEFRPFPQTPAVWKHILPDSVISQIIERGEEALKKDFVNIPATVMLEFVRNNNRTDYEKISFEKRNLLWDLVMAESMEGKGRFTDHIVDGIWSISEETFWGISAHVGIQKAGAGLPDVEDPIVDLFSAETGAVLAWTDYFVGPELDKVSKLIRPRIRYEITRRILVPMTTAKYGWMGSGNPNAKLNNWAPWIASNYIASNLLIEKDENKRKQGLNIAIKILNQYINGLGVDGGCDEGPGYWTAAGGCVFDALNLLYDATDGKLNIYRDPFIQKMGSYIYKTHIAGQYFINVADAHPTLKPDGLMIYRFGKDMDYEPMMNFGSWAYHTFSSEDDGVENFHRTRGLYNLLAIKQCVAYSYHESAVDDVWYSDVQLMASRSDNGLFVATHAGNNGESHNHNDVGDFVVYADGYPVIIDVGSGTYTARTFSKDRYKLWFNTSAYHNLPVINGIEQKEGIQFSATNVAYDKNKNVSQLSMNIKNAYPAEAGIKSWLRVVKMDKNTRVIKVEDKYAMAAKLTSLAQSLMTVCATDITSPGKIIFSLPDNSKVYLDYDNKLWDVHKEKIDLVTPEDQGLKHSWNGRDIWRILLTSKSGKLKNSIRYDIHK
ncbi:MAG: heparinase II/III family protein [Bacteroidota bacterium]|nr:heparinase II/III family protein [Bacteroidota bacterium]